MTWFKVDDDLAFHRKVVAAGNAAMGLWVRAGSWCAQHLTDGFVPEEMVGILGTPAQRAKLIKVGLWMEVPNGVQFHQWNENGRQPTAQSVREKRDRAAERQAKHRAAMYAKAQVSDERHNVTDASVTETVTPLLTPAPTRPDPSSSPDGELLAPPAAARARSATREPAQQPPAEPITAQTAVAAWIDAFEATGNHPLSRQVKQVGAESKQLIEAGNDPARVVELARTAGSKCRATVANELAIQVARRQPGARSARTTDDKRADVRGLVAQVMGTAALRPDLRAIEGGHP